MATPTKTICCRMCNDTGIKGGDTAGIMEMFESMMSGQEFLAGKEPKWCDCCVGVYRRHKAKSEAVST